MIFRNIVYAAIFVGLVSGLIYGVFQQTQLTPIIYSAEKFETNTSINNNEHEHSIESQKAHTE